MSGFDSIIYEVERGRARIILNRPKKLNALTLKLQKELNEALWEADNDRDVHCVILKGAGRAFSAGEWRRTASPCFPSLASIRSFSAPPRPERARIISPSGSSAGSCP